jgi:glycerophosphoryl diester phosphodiesterase
MAIDALPPPLILGHRGASAYAPENTLAAFRLALEQGADGFELDVALSRDEVVVVIHDDTADRTTDGHGRVDAMTVAQLKQLDASLPGKFGAQFKGERLPTLEEVFLAFGAPAAGGALPPFINVELKRDTSPGRQLAAQVVALIRAHGLERRVLLSSFYYDNLRRTKRLAPELPVGLLYAPDEPLRMLSAWWFPGVRAEAQNPDAILVNALTMRWWHWRGCRVNTWTVNAEPDLRRVMRLGVDGVITNYPDVAVRARRELQSISPTAN